LFKIHFNFVFSSVVSSTIRPPSIRFLAQIFIQAQPISFLMIPSISHEGSKF
jgi:hypothetical protein